MDIETLRRTLEYDPETGTLKWKDSGKLAGSKVGNGYRYVCIKGRHYVESRIAYWLGTGIDPAGMFVDHADRDPLNNRLSNLRLATPSQNRGNQKVRRDSKSGLKGVQRHKGGRWAARCGKRHLGLFDTPEEAHAAYREAAEHLFGEFARAA